MNIPKEPAVLIGLVMSILAGITQVMSQTADQSLTPWQWATIVLPLVVGIITRYQVVPVATVKDIITKARDTAGAVTELANVTATAIEDTPAARR